MTARYLLEIDAWTGSEVETLYLATETLTTGPSDSPANTKYVGAMLNAGELKRQLFENGGTIGPPAVNNGFFEIDNSDGSRTSWLEYGIGGRAFRLYFLDDGVPFSARSLVFTGSLRGFASSDFKKSLQLRIRDKIEELKKPLLTTVYAGTTTSSAATAEGNASMLGVVKPRVFGYVNVIEPKAANPFDLIYQVSTASYSILSVFDGGVQLLWDGTDYSTISALRSATITAGRFATASALGLFRLSSAPSKRVTCTAEFGTWLSGWASDHTPYEVGPLAQYILQVGGVSLDDIDTDSFSALVSTSGRGRSGLYIDDSTTTVLDAACEVLAGAGAALTSGADGKLRAVAIGVWDDYPGGVLDPSSPPEVAVDTFTHRDLSADSVFTLQSSPQAEGDGVPIYRVTVGYSKNYVTQTAGDLATSLNPGQIADLGQAYRYDVYLDTSILTAHPLAAAVTYETALTSLAGATTEMHRRVKLYGVPRVYLTVTISAGRVDRNSVIELGDVVALDIDHFGWSPKYFYVVGRWDKFGERKVTLTLWG